VANPSPFTNLIGERGARGTSHREQLSALRDDHAVTTTE